MAEVEPLSLMGERVKALYESGQLNDEGLARAVTKGWLTEEQKEQIIHPPQ